MEDYWGNLLDLYQKMWDMIEDFEELISSLATTFDSVQSHRTNEIMRVLTIISTIVLPLTFITGLYGMNVRLPWGDAPSAFVVIVLFCVVIAAFLIFFFNRKKWM